MSLSVHNIELIKDIINREFRGYQLISVVDHELRLVVNSRAEVVKEGLDACDIVISDLLTYIEALKGGYVDKVEKEYHINDLKVRVSEYRREHELFKVVEVNGKLMMSSISW